MNELQDPRPAKGDLVPVTSLEVRERLVEALKLDLVGPRAGHALAEERLPGWVRPSNWYLAGFLIPSGTPPEKRADADEDDDLAARSPSRQACLRSRTKSARLRRRVSFRRRWA